ncbi:MAG: thioredoxin family protein [Candidatus Peregrinibacteria bacterium]|nr:thioredoxin family protein [Candidatus Peregrinibacteria bacterium]MDZ4245277.1 thioredoxin family protein [Candidatus Gracilibacteria bacterium]
MVLLESEMVALGSGAHDFSLMGIDEVEHPLSDWADKEVLVMVFMCNHCPYVQAVWDRLNKLQSRFEGRGVQLIGVNPNAANPNYPDDSFEEMKKAPKLFGMNFPYLIDEDQSVSRAYRAVCTPDIFVYDKERKLVYRGRIDDNWQDAGAAQSNELADSLEAILSGEEVSNEQKPAMGCSIKWTSTW